MAGVSQEIIMNDDHLFVCFSQKALAARNGTPPFHNEIKTFAANLNKTSFSEFYDGRFNWHWYPIVTSGFSSFPTHGDLLGKLTNSAVISAIGYAEDICSREDGKRFISVLGLLSLLCRSVDSPKTVPKLTNHFMAIRERVTANAIDPNIHYWFSKVAFYQLNTGAVPNGYEGSFDRAGLNAPKKDGG